MEYNSKQEQSLHKKDTDQQAQCFCSFPFYEYFCISIILCLPINYLCIFFLPVFLFVSMSVSQPVPLSHISFVLSHFSRGKYNSSSVRCNWARAAWEQFLSNNEPPFALWALPVPGVKKVVKYTHNHFLSTNINYVFQHPIPKKVLLFFTANLLYTLVIASGSV